MARTAANNGQQLPGPAARASSTRVGVKEFKNRATQIVRDIRERSASYVITVDGKPVATVRPYDAEDETWATAAEVEQWLDELDLIADEIGEAWPPGLSAVDAIRAQRREL